MADKMNIVCIPYHDWRKINKEGFRTRDAHMIEHLEKSDEVGKVLIVNRPITPLELFIKKKGARIKGPVVLRGKGFTLHQVSEKLYVLDVFFLRFLKPFTMKKGWFYRYFGHSTVVSAVNKCSEWMNLQPRAVLSQNIFAAGLFHQLAAPVKVFDAWDNFILFPSFQYIKEETRNAYAAYARDASFWITNSDKNITFYREQYGVEKCDLIRNGVDTEKFEKKYPVPADLKPIKHPIIGFGGKITHLFDYALYNHAAKANPDKSFVIIGELLDQKVFDLIEKPGNVFYLGDKSYESYPAYITNFDMGVIPYVTNELDSGADSIKAYEYVAAGLQVVATSGGGTDSISSAIRIGKTKEAFAELISKSSFTRNKNQDIPLSGQWSSKVGRLVKLIRDGGIH